ncbi:MAG: metal ABC transporter permease [Planctomycetota bacterium]|nr:metal ABC transporter permease [Planctomycetota bacterium]
MLDGLLFPFESMDRNILAMIMIAVMSAYLGVYIVCKRIVFVGVSLAEISALGIGFAFYATDWAVALGFEPHAWEEQAPLILSVLFTLVGVVLFSVHHSGKRVTQESLIGVGYAIAAGLAVLFIWQSAEGKEKLNHLVAGDVILTTEAQFIVLSITFVVLGVLHLLFSKEILFSALDKDSAQSFALPARLFDLFLYLSIGIAVAVSLRTGSILLVVGFMIVPPVTGLLLVNRFGHVQLVAIAVGVSACVLAAPATFYNPASGLWYDPPGGLPMSPTVVAVQAVFLVAAWIASRWSWTRRALLRGLGLTTGIAVVLCSVSLSHLLLGTQLVGESPLATALDRKFEQTEHDRTLDHLESMLHSSNRSERIEAIHLLVAWDDPHAADLLIKALQDEDPAVQGETITALGESKGSRAAWALETYLETRFPSADLVLQVAEALGQLGSPEAVHTLIHLLEESALPPFIRLQATKRLEALVGESYDLRDEHGWRDWWEENHKHLRWDDEKNRFFVHRSGQEKGR